MKRHAARKSERSLGNIWRCWTWSICERMHLPMITPCST